MKKERQIEAIKRLLERPGTEGERAAAQAALDRLTAMESGAPRVIKIGFTTWTLPDAITDEEFDRRLEAIFKKSRL